MPSVFQYKCAFVSELGNLAGTHQDRLAKAGMKGVFLKLYEDGDPLSPTIARNMSVLEQRLAELRARKLVCGVWANVRGAPEDSAMHVSQLCADHKLSFAVFDCELYGANVPVDLAKLLRSWRALRPQMVTAISSYGYAIPIFDWDAVIRYKAEFLPQCYEWAMKPDGHYDPVWSVQNWIARGYDPSLYHPTLEVTGLEGAHLDWELCRLYESRASGYKRGMSVYLAENMTQADADLLAGLPSLSA